MGSYGYGQIIPFPWCHNRRYCFFLEEEDQGTYGKRPHVPWGGGYSLGALPRSAGFFTSDLAIFNSRYSLHTSIMANLARTFNK